MKETITKLYYRLNSEQFQEYLDKLKNSLNTIHFFTNEKTSYFCVIDNDVNNQIIELHKQQNQFDNEYNYLSISARQMVKELLFVEEIKYNNEIENLHSTRRNIYSVLKQVKNITDKHILSSLNTFKILESRKKIEKIEDIREIYDVMMKNAFETANDKPDGKVFRKDSVEVNNGIRKVHEGYYPEEKIIRTMNEFVDVYTNDDLDIYLKTILSHFLLETIHPFYDGNGRLGRLLISLNILSAENSIASYCISKAINNHKKEYYEAIESAREIHEYGCLNHYFTIMAKILEDGIITATKQLKKNRMLLDQLQKKELPFSMSKSEKTIYNLLLEASVYSYAGLSNKSIIELTGLSKRTVSYCMNKFRNNYLITDNQIGKEVYHKIVGINEYDD